MEPEKVERWVKISKNDLIDVFFIGNFHIESIEDRMIEFQVFLHFHGLQVRVFISGLSSKRIRVYCLSD